MSINGRSGLLAVAALAVALGACRGGDVTSPCRAQAAVTPSVLLLSPGGQGRLVAQGAVNTGQCQLAGGVRWDAQDTAVARVRADTGLTALVTAVAPGSTFVIATFLADTTVRTATLVQVGTGAPPGQQ